MARTGLALARCLAIGSLACVPGISVAQAVESDAAQAAPTADGRMRWSLTSEELAAAVQRYEARHGVATDPFMEEVEVITPPVPLKMRDLTQEIWTGPAAPFWALLHPANSWRILLPIPPKRAPSDDAFSDRQRSP
jgi:hypothetical protein